MEINHLLSSESLILASQLSKCLWNYLDVFLASNAKKLVLYRDIDLAIELQPGKEPLYGLIYPLSQTELAALRDFLEENLAKGFIRESKSPTSIPILFAPKKDSGLRLYIDYRGDRKSVV